MSEEATEMELRVAAAICSARFGGSWAWAKANEVEMSEFVFEARAAIRAMKLDTQDNPIMDAFQCANFEEWNRAIDAVTAPDKESSTAAVPRG